MYIYTSQSSKNSGFFGVLNKKWCPAISVLKRTEDYFEKVVVEMNCQVGNHKVEFPRQDLAVQERNLDVEQNVLQRIVLFVWLRLQVHGFPDSSAFRTVDQGGTGIQDMAECVLDNARLDRVMVGPRMLGSYINTFIEAFLIPRQHVCAESSTRGKA